MRYSTSLLVFQCLWADKQVMCRSRGNVPLGWMCDHHTACSHGSANATAKVTDAETRVSDDWGEKSEREALKMFYCNVHALFLM